MRHPSSVMLVLPLLTILSACERGASSGDATRFVDVGRFSVTSLRRTLPGRPEPEELIVRVNTATGEAWILAGVEKDRRMAHRWVRIPEPVKETQKTPSGIEYTIEENVEDPH